MVAGGATVVLAAGGPMVVAVGGPFFLAARWSIRLLNSCIGLT